MMQQGTLTRNDEVATFNHSTDGFKASMSKDAPAEYTSKSDDMDDERMEPASAKELQSPQPISMITSPSPISSQPIQTAQPPKRETSDRSHNSDVSPPQAHTASIAPSPLLHSNIMDTAERKQASDLSELAQQQDPNDTSAPMQSPEPTAIPSSDPQSSSKIDSLSSLTIQVHSIPSAIPAAHATSQPSPARNDTSHADSSDDSDEEDATAAEGMQRSVSEGAIPSGGLVPDLSLDGSTPSGVKKKKEKGVSCHQCFAPSTQLLLSNGESIRAEDVQVGMDLLDEFGQPIRVTHAQCAFRTKNLNGGEACFVPNYSADGTEFPLKQRFNFSLTPTSLLATESMAQTDLTVTADHSIELISNQPIVVTQAPNGILQITYWSVWHHDIEDMVRPPGAPDTAESWPMMITSSTDLVDSGNSERNYTLALSWASKEGICTPFMWSPNACDYHDWLWYEWTQNPSQNHQAWSMYQPSALSAHRSSTAQGISAVTLLQFKGENSFQKFLESCLPKFSECQAACSTKEGDRLISQLSWMIGYWLGVARMLNSKPSVNELLQAAPDQTIYDRIAGLHRLLVPRTSRDWFELLLNELGIWNEPQFPRMMLLDEFQVRLHLLAGYIDVLGEVDSRVSHTYQISSVEAGLLHLVRGLGFKATISMGTHQGTAQLQVSGVPSDARFVDSVFDPYYVPVVMSRKRIPPAALDLSSYNWQCAVSPDKYSPLATKLPASIEYVMIEVNRFNASGQKLPSEFQSHNLLSAESIVYHNCKTNKDDSTLLFCVNKAEKGQKKRNCRKKYCDACLRRAYNTPIDSLTPEEIAGWHCPACQDKCVCAACARKHENVNSNDKAAAMQRLLQIGPGAAMALMSGVRPNVALMQLQIAAAHAAGVQPSAMTPEQSAAVLRSAGAVVTPAAIAPAQPSSSPTGTMNGGSATPALSTPIVAGGSVTPITAAKVVLATPATSSIATPVATSAEEIKKEDAMLFPTNTSVTSNSASPAPVVATAVASIRSQPVTAGIVVSGEAVPASTGNQSKKRTKSGTKTSVKAVNHMQIPQVPRPSISAPVSPAHSSSTAVLSFPPSNQMNSVNTIPFPGGLFSASSQGPIPSTISHPNRRINRDEDKYQTMPERHRRHSLKVTPMSIRNGPHHTQIARALLVQEDDSDSSGGSAHARQDFSLPSNFASQVTFDQSRDSSSSSSYHDSIHTRPTKHYKSKGRRNSVPHLMHRSTAQRPNADAIAVNNEIALPAIDLSQNGEEDGVQQPPQRQRQVSAHSNASHSHTPITPSQGIVVNEDPMMMSPPHQHAFISPRTQQHLNGSSSSSSQLAPSSKPFGAPSNYYDASNPNSHLHLSPSQPNTMLISPSSQNHLLQPTIQISPQVSPRSLEYQQSMLASYLQQQQQQPIYASPRTMNSQVESEFLNHSNSQLLESIQHLSHAQGNEGLNLSLSLDDPATLNTINQLQVTVQSVINSKTAHPVQHSRSAFQSTQLPRLPQVSNDVQQQRSPLNMHQQQLLLNQSSQVASPQNHLHLQAMSNTASFRQQSDQLPLDLPPFQPDLPIDPSFSSASGGDAFSFDPFMTTGASSTSYSQHASPTFSFTTSQPFFHKQVSRSNTSTPSFLNSSPNNSPRNLLFSNHQQLQNGSMNTSHSMATTAVTAASRYSMSPSDPSFRANSPNSSAFVTHSNMSSTSTAGSSQFYSMNTQQGVQFHAGTSDQHSDPLQMMEEAHVQEQEDTL